MYQAQESSAALAGTALPGILLDPTVWPNSGAEAGSSERSLVRLALASVEGRLCLEPGSADLRFQRACLLEHTGQTDAAVACYGELLEREPTHTGALNGLGTLLVARGRRAEARPLLLRAVAADPEHLASRANLGNLLMQEHEVAASVEQFQAALRVDPEYRAAHAGLSFAFDVLGDQEAASLHRRRAFADRSIVIAAYCGERPPITVLELVSTTGGNFHTDPFLSNRVFQRVLVTTEFYAPGTPLPPHDLVINAIGEADSACAALRGALAVLAGTDAPVINRPSAVLATGRCEIAKRLAGIPGVVTARTVTLPRVVLQGAGAEQALKDAGLAFPLLLRTPGFHGGDHFVRVESADSLAGALGELPGEELLAMQYLNARGPDGNSRKFRAMMVDGELYPLHVAISRHWKIHYFSADMAEHPEHRAEDAAFLANMEGVVGPRAMAALRAIQATLGLDYGGIDFGLNDRGEVLVFEANATMAVVLPDKDARWDYRRPAVERIYKAVWEMLRQRAQPSRTATL
jgi:tetratricopeptide (TPR) repeat protein